MANWRSDFELAMRADELANVMLTMCSVTGSSPTVPGMDPREGGEQVIRSSLITDAEEFMSLDPARLADEFNQQVRAGQQTGDPQAGADITYAQDVLDPNVWHGTAAEAFHKQMSYMHTFADQQAEQTARAAQAAGMMYTAAVQFRDSFYGLQDATVAACNAKIRETPISSGINWGSVAVDMVSKLADAVSAKGLADLAKSGVDAVLGLAGGLHDEDPPDGEPAAIIDGYVTAKTRIFDSYQQNLGSIADWVTARRGDLAALALPLLEPLPSTTDVDSPDFRYENFSYGTPIPGVTGATVEEERKRYADEHKEEKPHGVIATRLAGG